MSLHFLLRELFFFFLSHGFHFSKMAVGQLLPQNEGPDYGHTCTHEQVSLALLLGETS